MKFINGARLISGAALATILSSQPAQSFGVVPASRLASSARAIFGGSNVISTSTQLNAEPIKITMPALSSTMKEGRVVSWLKSEGDSIEAGEAIMVVESDKADMDVEAFEDGYLAKIITAEGESAPVGEVVALVASLEEEIDAVIASYGSGGASPAAAVETVAAEAAPAASGEFTEIFMPALSSTMSEGKVVEWLKGVGDFVQAGEALMVVESDKADMDVEAFEDGYLAKIIVDEGKTADVGAPVGILVVNQEDVAMFANNAPLPTPLPSTVVKTTAPAASAAPEVEFSQIDMPALSSTMKEGKVVSWLKAEGDPISAGEAIMVVESDKADMDVEAFEDGFLAAIITGEGETGAVGAPVALIAQEESDIPVLKAYAATLSGAATPAAIATPAAAAAAPAAPKIFAAPKPSAAASGDRVVASPLAKKRAEELGLDLSTVAGTGPGGRVTAGDVEAAAAGVPAKGKAAPAAPAKPSWTPAPGVIAATPTARALAKKAKIDLATIQGTGEFGRVTADDVLIATGQKEPERKRASPTGSTVVEMPGNFVPFTGMQRAVSNNMVATLSIPEFRVSREIEMDNFDNLYQKLKPQGVTVSAMLAKAVALAIEKHPIINSSYSEQGGQAGIQYNKDINIAMAVAIDGGLITPTLKYANERGVVELGDNWKELVAKAKSGTLSPDEYKSGTFTISNMGMFGVTDFGAILPAGMGGILAIGGTQEVIVPDSSAVLGMKKVKKMKVTLTCDHRQIYGADAALFLKTLADIMENKCELVSV
jgi:pyruvate dehydrogenase E2 component (dihydrolipoamide acetyltransferase)